MKAFQFLLILCCIAIGAQALAQSQTYYTWDGIALNEVHGDPAEATPDHWEIWLYRSHAAHTETSRWGMISKSSFAEANKELKADQLFERRYEKFVGGGIGSYGPCTSFNPSAP